MRLKPIQLILGALAVAVITRAANIIYNQPLVAETALAYSKNYSIDLQANGIGSLSAQAVYSSATIASATFTDGRQSTGSFTVVTNTALSTAPAVNQVTVVSTSGLRGATLTLPGFVLQNGVDWATADTSSNTAESIKLALARTGLLVSRAAGSSVVYATAPAAGTYYNSFTFLSSTPTALSVATPNFTGGQNNATVAINGVILKESVNWSRGNTSSNTAASIASAINANSVLSALVTAGASGSVVTATSTTNGSSSLNVNFLLASSTPTALSASGSNMVSGSAPSATLSGQISLTGHGMTTALPVLYTSGSVSLGGLTNQTTYFVVPVDANTIKLSDTSTGAVAGLFTTFTSSTTQLTAHTATLAPLPITGTPGFKWQVSNDGSNWSDLAVSSVTMSSYSTPPASTLWSFGFIGTRYVRLAVTAPTTGGISLAVQAVGTN